MIVNDRAGLLRNTVTTIIGRRTPVVLWVYHFFRVVFFCRKLVKILFQSVV